MRHQRLSWLLLFAAFVIVSSSARPASFSGVRGVRPVVAFPDALGEAAYQVKGAMGNSALAPVGLPLGTLADDADGCTNVGGDNESCPDKCDDPGDGASDGVCSFREIINYPAPRYMTCQVAGAARPTLGKWEVNYDYLTIDGAACPGPLILANWGLRVDPGLKHIIVRNLTSLPLGEWAETDVGTRTGCNTVRWYCSPSPPGSGTTPVTIAGVSAFSDTTGVGTQCTQGDDSTCDTAEGLNSANAFCRAFDRSKYGADRCDYCSSIDHSTGDVSECSDAHVIGGSGTDGFSLVLPQGVILDRVAAGWGPDGQIDVNLYSASYDPLRARNTTVSNSIIGPGTETPYISHREDYHALGSLYTSGGTSNLNTDLSLCYGHTLARNVWLLVSYRSPWIAGCEGRDTQSVRYRHWTDGRSGLSPRDQSPLSWDFMDSLFIADADQEKIGYCSVSGRACSATDSPCGGGEGTCSSDRYVTLQPTMSGAQAGSLYIDRLKVEKPDGNIQAAPGAPELDEFWDTLAFSSTNVRPNRNPNGLGVAPTEDENTLWSRKRTSPHRLVLPRLTPEQVEGLESSVGAMGPVYRNPVIDEWFDLLEERGTPDDQSFMPYPGPRVYPVYSTLPDWTDTDEDGLPDWWESDKCGSPTACIASSYSTKGPPWHKWQEFIHRDAFGDPVAHVYADGEAPSGNDCEVGSCVIGTGLIGSGSGGAPAECDDGIDNDGDGDIDFDGPGAADPDAGCRDADDPDERNFSVTLPTGMQWLTGYTSGPNEMSQYQTTPIPLSPSSADSFGFIGFNDGDDWEYVDNPYSLGDDEGVLRVVYPSDLGNGQGPERWVAGAFTATPASRLFVEYSLCVPDSWDRTAKQFFWAQNDPIGTAHNHFATVLAVGAECSISNPDCGYGVFLQGEVNDTFATGYWDPFDSLCHHIAYYFQHGDPGTSNAIAKTWIDGSLVVDEDAFQSVNTLGNPAGLVEKEDAMMQFVWWDPTAAAGSTTYYDLDAYRVAIGWDCSDGIDNDNDSDIDFPADSDCDSSMDVSED